MWWSRWLDSVTAGVTGVVAVALALFATLGEGSTDDSKSGSDKDSESASTGASSKDEPIPVGTAEEVSEGWDLTVNSSTLDTDAAMAAANEFNARAPGTKFVLVNATVTNTSDEPGEPMMETKASLLPPAGVAADWTSCLAPAPDELDLSAQMQPGATATGNLGFSLKPEEIPGSVLLAEPQLTLDKNKAQRFFALS